MKMLVCCIVCLSALMATASDSVTAETVTLSDVDLQPVVEKGRIVKHVGEWRGKGTEGLRRIEKLDFSNILNSGIGLFMEWPSAETAAAAEKLAKENKLFRMTVPTNEVAKTQCPILKTDDLVVRPSTREILVAHGRCLYKDRAVGTRDFNECLLKPLLERKAKILKRDPAAGKFIYSWKNARGLELVCGVYVTNIEEGGIGFDVQVLKKSDAQW